MPNPRHHARLPAQRLRVRGDAPPRRRRRARRRRHRQHLRRDRRSRAPGRADDPQARRERPDARIIVTGCAAQIEPERFADMAEVDHVIGNAEKTAGRNLPAGLRDATCERVAVNDIMSRAARRAGHLIDGFGSARAPMCRSRTAAITAARSASSRIGRGPSRSVPAGEVVAQVRRLVEAGYAEVVLTGVDITSYGADLPGADVARAAGAPDPGARAGAAAPAAVVDRPGRGRRRLMDAIAEEQRLMPHLHLSLQAGDDMILKRMKRRHLARRRHPLSATRSRRLRPDIAFGADLIAGFPTETEAMFDNTLDLVDDCGLTYPARLPVLAAPGTPAARMPQVDRAPVKERAARLRATGRAGACARHLDRPVRRAASSSDGARRRRPHAAISPRSPLTLPTPARPILTAPRHRPRRPAR